MLRKILVGTEYSFKKKAPQAGLLSTLIDH